MTEPERHLVSVVVPLFNAAPYIGAAIDSVIDQDYRPLEIVVVDDGSTDSGPDVVARMVARTPGLLRLAHQPNRGCGAARNHGVRLATGQLLAFLDADDLWTPGSLRCRVGAITADPNIDMVCGWISEFVTPGLSPAARARLRAPVSARATRTSSTMLVRRRAFERVGPYDERTGRGVDLEWFLRADDADLTVREVAVPVLRRRLHDTNTGVRKAGQEGDYVRTLKAALDRRRAAAAPGTR
jgi:glycosyltransferase involved in cell wall biosynthesis